MVSAGLATHAGRYLWDLRTPMRDGVELSSDVYLPENGLRGGSYPLVLVRTPDGNQSPPLVEYARHLAVHGYAVALQDVRGRHDSAGRFRPFHGEGEDGHDSIEWFAAQPWCNGRIGTSGSFYDGWAQWVAAALQPPHLMTMVSTSSMGGGPHPIPYRGGALRLPLLPWLHGVAARNWQDGSQVDWTRVLQHLPLRTMDRALGRDVRVWRDWLDHPTLDEHWAAMSLGPEQFAAIDMPVLHVTGWYDENLDSAVRLHDGMRAHSPAAADQRLLIGPWDRAAARSPRKVVGGVDHGADAVVDMAAIHLRWFDRWLEDAPDGGTPIEPSRCFVTGGGAWRSGDVLAAAVTPEVHHLRGATTDHDTGGGRLLAEAPGDEPADTFVYDPADPVVSTTDLTFFPTPPLRPVDPPLDRRAIERRDDVLTYTSDAATGPFMIVGSPRLQLFAGSDCPDTDWVVTLTDVAPSGASVVIGDGVLRARHREGLDREVAMQPGDSHEFVITLGPVAHQVGVGHRLRLALTSSLFPVFDRNLNTGSPIGTDEEPRIATNVVFHDAARPSHLVLPVVDAAGTETP